jgi:hypothetical protein
MILNKNSPPQAITQRHQLRRLNLRALLIRSCRWRCGRIGLLPNINSSHGISTMCDWSSVYKKRMTKLCCLSIVLKGSQIHGTSFFRCRYSMSIWNSLLSWLGIDSVYTITWANFDNVRLGGLTSSTPTKREGNHLRLFLCTLLGKFGLNATQTCL